MTVIYYRNIRLFIDYSITLYFKSLKLFKFKIYIIYENKSSILYNYNNI